MRLIEIFPQPWHWWMSISSPALAGPYFLRVAFMVMPIGFISALQLASRSPAFSESTCRDHRQ